MTGLAMQHYVRKVTATVVAAAMFVLAPVVIPKTFVPQGTQVAMIVGCGSVAGNALPLDTAFAGIVPCPIAAPQPLAPTLPIILGVASVGSVITNAFIVGRTQCRELTYQEAWTSALLPFIGIAFNQQNSQCGAKPAKHHR